MNPRGLLTVREAAHFFAVDRFTVQRWIWARKLTALRKGRRWLIPASEGKEKFQQREEVKKMPTKRELEERVAELEEKLEEARDLIDEALWIEAEDDDGSDHDDD